MSTLFISDLHLSADHPDTIERFLEFMSLVACHSSTLYILGDLFEVWVGDDHIDSELIPVISALRKYTKNGNQLFVMHGNRDFLLGPQFEKLTGCIILSDPHVIKLNGIKTALSHGDMFCTDDIDYQVFKSKVRTPEWQQMFLAQPIEKRTEYAFSVRNKSKTDTNIKPPEIMDVNQSSINQQLRALSVTQLIHGHTHRLNTHQFTLDNQVMVRYVLGDWHKCGSVLVCSNNGCSLRILESGIV
ncbi:MAG: UDP-2,3-diacylglucosamine diphosphatase [Gammaproteobacteria bacterium]|nr:UDP-2,3-diacylglucosamine diphosphatase [Gammaproteobacteria bacterium]